MPSWRHRVAGAPIVGDPIQMVAIGMLTMIMLAVQASNPVVNVFVAFCVADAIPQSVY